MLRLIVILKLSTNSSTLSIQLLIYVLEQNEHSPEFLSSQAYNKLFLTRLESIGFAKRSKCFCIHNNAGHKTTMKRLIVTNLYKASS